MELRRLEENIAANEEYVKVNYPGEIFISEISETQAAKKYIKGLIIPENVKVAESRLPANSEQRKILRKELRQGEILAKLGNSVFLIPEHAAYGERPKDAVVNGQLFEFRTITGNAKTLEWEYRRAKKKGDDTNVYISILSGISRNETERRIKLVLDRHPEYTGKIVISWKGGRPHFEDTKRLRQKKSLPYGRAGWERLN